MGRRCAYHRCAGELGHAAPPIHDLLSNRPTCLPDPPRHHHHTQHGDVALRRAAALLRGGWQEADLREAARSKAAVHERLLARATTRELASRLCCLAAEVLEPPARESTSGTTSKTAGGEVAYGMRRQRTKSPKNHKNNHSAKASAAPPPPKTFGGHDARHASDREAHSHTAIDMNPMATMHDWRGFSEGVQGSISRSVLPPERHLLASSTEAAQELLELNNGGPMGDDAAPHAWRVGDAALVSRCRRWEPASVFEIEAPGPGTDATEVRLRMRLHGHGQVADLWVGLKEWRTRLRPLTTLAPDGGRLNTGHFCKSGDVVAMDCFDLCEGDFWVPPQRPVALVLKAMAQIDSAIVELTTLVATETITVPNSLTRRLEAESYNGMVSKVAAVRAETVRLIDALLAGASATVSSLPMSTVGETRDVKATADAAPGPSIAGKGSSNGGCSIAALALASGDHPSTSTAASSVAPADTEAVSKHLEGKLIWRGIIKVPPAPPLLALPLSLSLSLPPPPSPITYTHWLFLLLNSCHLFCIPRLLWNGRHDHDPPRSIAKLSGQRACVSVKRLGGTLTAQALEGEDDEDEKKEAGDDEEEQVDMTKGLFGKHPKHQRSCAERKWRRL